MLTIPHLALLIKYRWNLHLFEQHSSIPEKELTGGRNRDALARLLQDMKHYRKNLVSTEYATKILAELRALSSDKATTQTFLGHANTF